MFEKPPNLPPTFLLMPKINRTATIFCQLVNEEKY
jgi:hypothetical protein